MIHPDATGVVPSFDGTRIAYQTFGQGPPLLWGNGIGVGYRGVRLQIEHLRQRFRVVTLDHRGVFESDPPGPGGVTMEAHARDWLAVIDHLELERPAYCGWSMGVQVGFEVLRLERARFRRMACIGGVAGSPFRGAMPLPGIDRALPPVVEAVAAWAPALSPVASPLIASSAFLRVAKLARFVRPNADEASFVTMLEGVASHDHRLYLRTLAEIGRHDAEAIVPHLDLPILFLAGGDDYLTPRRELERLARLAPRGEVHTVEGTSHFVILEAPDQTNRLLEDFFSAADEA
ncbi:MAG: alpha/beta hydrolase [Deltaproteobacteria bacterium]|jgi:pimeloyl-ACP methyl ester carboxylesterase|nr:alpha/beta hydrolase [Deltaproteobacteria bacterium]MBW2536968.1 alpha/beta hydrolase [Deltaproteobacteria bacterium]